jgi:glycerol kinase
MAFSSAELLSTMCSTEGLNVPVLRVDGGAAANDWMMQFQADVLGIPVERPDLVETTAVGAAGLAGLAAGVWASADQFLSSRRFTRFEPQLSRSASEALLRGWQRAVGAALAWAGPRETRALGT